MNLIELLETTPLGVKIMPKKIRQFIKDIQKEGFKLGEGGKGSHRKFVHPIGPVIIVAGKLGDDVKEYLEKQFNEHMKRIRDEEAKDKMERGR